MEGANAEGAVQWTLHQQSKLSEVMNKAHGSSCEGVTLTEYG
jgi:hypothetical protein